MTEPCISCGAAGEHYLGRCEDCRAQFRKEPSVHASPKGDSWVATVTYKVVASPARYDTQGVCQCIDCHWADSNGAQPPHLDLDSTLIGADP